MLALLKAPPFVPFRFILSYGGTVELKTPESVLPSKQLAVVGKLDPSARLIDRWTIIWYVHVTRVEQLAPGAPPLFPPLESSGSPTPTPAPL